MRTQRLDEWRQRVRSLKTEAHAVYLASKDPRVPWYAKALAACVLAYLFSPIDLIPDFIPVLGYLDDLILVPLGLVLVLRLVPREVMLAAREKAAAAADRPVSRAMATVIVVIWAVAIGGIGLWLWQVFNPR